MKLERNRVAALHFVNVKAKVALGERLATDQPLRDRFSQMSDDISMEQNLMRRTAILVSPLVKGVK